MGVRQFRKLGRLNVIDNAMSRLSVADRVRRLPAGVAEIEIAYATVRDRWEAELSRYKQLLAEREGCQDRIRIDELRYLIDRTNGRMVMLRRLAQDIGAMAFSRAFHDVAQSMLAPTAFDAVRAETEAIMGRSLFEIRNRTSDSGEQDTVDGVIGKFRALLVEAGLIDQEGGA